MNTPRPEVLTTSTRVLHVPSHIPRSDRPPEFAADVCFSPDLVSVFIEAYTAAGDLVFDPFAGFGTTIRTAEEMGRRALGFEIDEERVAFARRALREPTRMQHVDVRHADWSRLPEFRLSISSPPYMTHSDHPQNPLSGYQTLDGDYRRYLSELQEIYLAVGRRAADADTRIVVNAANLHETRLAWDIGNVLSDVLHFDREIIVDWDPPQDWFTQDYCLVFQPRPAK
jgi:tRNA G10  N-methylase Trm11